MEYLDHDGLQQWWLVTRLLTGGTLGDLRKQMGKRVCPTLVWHVLKQLMEALAFLHGHLHLDSNEDKDQMQTAKVITHGDIHDGNICFDLTSPPEFDALPNLRLIDLGCARASVASSSSMPKMQHYHSHTRNRSETTADVAFDLASVGLIVHKLAHPTGFLPPTDATDADSHAAIPPVLINGQCPSYLLPASAAPSTSPPFSASDSEFHAVIKKAQPWHVQNQSAEHYHDTVRLAARRRLWAFVNMRDGEEVPEFDGARVEVEMNMIRARVSEEVEIREEEGRGEGWGRRWRGVLDRGEEGDEKDETRGELKSAVGSDGWKDADDEAKNEQVAVAAVEHAEDEDGDVIMTYY